MENIEDAVRAEEESIVTWFENYDFDSADSWKYREILSSCEITARSVKEAAALQDQLEEESSAGSKSVNQSLQPLAIMENEVRTNIQDEKTPIIVIKRGFDYYNNRQLDVNHRLKLAEYEKPKTEHISTRCNRRIRQKQCMTCHESFPCQIMVHDHRKPFKYTKRNAGLQIILISIAVLFFYHSIHIHYGWLFMDLDEIGADCFYYYSWSYISLLIPAAVYATNRSAQKLLSACVAGSGLLHLGLAVYAASQGDEQYWSKDTPHTFHRMHSALRFLWHTLFGCVNAPVLPCVYALLARLVPDNFRATIGSVILNIKWLGMFSAFLSAFCVNLVGLRHFDTFGVYMIFGVLAPAWAIVYWFVGANCDVEIVNRAPGFKPKVPWRSMFTSLPVGCLIVFHSLYFFTQFCTLRDYSTFYNFSGPTVQNRLNRQYDIVPWVMLIGSASGILSDLLAQRTRLVTTAKARKSLNFLGSVVPMGVAAAYFLLVRDNYGRIEYDDNWEHLSLGLSALTCLQTSGFLINHMDLSPYYAAVLVAVTEAANHVVTFFTIVALNYWEVNNFENFINVWLSDTGLLIWLVITALSYWSNVIFIFFGQTSIQTDWSPIPMSLYRIKNKLNVMF